MRVAVFSDTHGNLAALDAVLADLDATGPFDAVVMGGDFAFGGPFPSACIDRIRERGIRAVRGNTDEFIVEVATDGARPAQGVEEHQRHGSPQLSLDRWIADCLTAEQVDYLADLPLQVTVPDTYGRTLAVVHATPWSAHPQVYADAPTEVVQRLFREAGSAVLGYGHIHLQYERRLDGHLLVAVGSVGLPFDGDTRAAYAVFTSSADGWSVEFRRTPYDLEATAVAALASGAPNAEGFVRTLRQARLSQG